MLQGGPSCDMESGLGRFPVLDARYSATAQALAGYGMRRKRQATRRSPTASQLPLLGSNQDSPDPVPLRLSSPLHMRSVRGLDCAFTFAITRSGGSHPVSTPSPLGAWLGVASQGFADFESIHTRRFRPGVQRAHRRVLLESGVLPVTPRGIGLRL